MTKSASLKYILPVLVFFLLAFSPLRAQFNSKLPAKEFNASLLRPDRTLHQSQMSLPVYNTFSYRTVKISKQVVLSQFSGAALGFAAVLLQAALAPQSKDYVPQVMYGGYIAGMTLGVHFLGNDRYEHAGFGKTLVGALIGLPVGYLIYKSDSKPHGFSALAPFVFPTLGAVISFNLSARPRTEVYEN